MHGRRILSQRNYEAVQAIRIENERQKQADRGLTYRRNAIERGPAGEARPLYVGPQIEAQAIAESVA